MLIKIFNAWLLKFTEGKRFLARMITVWIGIASLGILIYFGYGVYVLRHIRISNPEHPIAQFFPLMIFTLIILGCLIFLEIKFMTALKITRKPKA
jgi:hypothetical protein